MKPKTTLKQNWSAKELNINNETMDPWGGGTTSFDGFRKTTRSASPSKWGRQQSAPSSHREFTIVDSSERAMGFVPLVPSSSSMQEEQGWATAVRSDDSAQGWSQDQSWFQENSSSVVLGTSLRPIPIMDLEARERDLFNQASRKKQDQEEAHRDHDLLMARNKVKQRHFDDDGSTGKRSGGGLLRIFGVSQSVWWSLSVYSLSLCTY